MTKHGLEILNLHSFQWRENVFELGADIVTFSNLVPTKRYFQLKLSFFKLKTEQFIENSLKHGAD